MIDSKNLLFDKKVKGGGFYELCIQVCPSLDNNPINLYTDFLWTQLNIEGPFEETWNGYRYTKLEYENGGNDGILNIKNYSIPFVTINIKESFQIESASNWFNICFHEETLNAVFNIDNFYSNENSKFKKIIDEYLEKILKQLYRIFPFQLATINHEVSGLYYLEKLKENGFSNWTDSKIFIGKEKFKEIKEEYK